MLLIACEPWHFYRFTVFIIDFVDYKRHKTIWPQQYYGEEK